MIRTICFARFLMLTLFLAVAGQVIAPAQAQQTPFNPTARAVNEDSLLKALKDGQTINGRITIPDRNAATLIQPEGQAWRDYRRDFLPRFGAIVILGTLVLLGVFYAWRGKVRIEAGESGQRIVRFVAIERFTHWLTAMSFVVLGLSGLNVTFGRSMLLPVIGHEAFTSFSIFAKYLHNYVGFAFMIGLVLMFLIWVKDNLPGAVDVAWFKAGGGILKNGKHPAARKFNGGQKLVFWGVVIGGGFMSLSGWHLLFPNLTDGGVVSMQFHSMVHGIIAMLMVAMICGHIYIGTIGMEGAFDAMGRGDVDLNWAKEHHSLWVQDELGAKGGKGVIPAAVPAE